ncbi:MAG: LysR family transcriptional regulator, partial [Rhodospirillaceae bacterium]|nr:LysR family transcriptional regulator [Rhodospirillaceae bacterium]
MYQLPPVNWLRAFEASARRESFTAAADELARTPKSVSTQVRALEAELGFALFERMRHGLRLTDMGRAYLPAVRKAFEDLSATTAGLFGPKGTPTIT